MAGVLACLQPEAGPARPSGSYGEVAGSQPNWRGNFCDSGKRHVGGPQADFGSTGFQRWLSDEAPATDARPARRHIDQPSSSCYAEPAVAGGRGSYYTRRTAAEGDGVAGYRRSQRYVPEPQQPDRPEGKRAIPEPYGAPPAPRGTRPPPDDVMYRPAQSLPEPELPRLARPGGVISGLRESDKEIAFESSLGRKARVGDYRGTGRAGDMSLVYGASVRVEDAPGYYNAAKDSPSFLRFCSSLPAKPAASPHDRRAAGMHRAKQAEVQRERELVSTLVIPGVDDDQ